MTNIELISGFEVYNNISMNNNFNMKNQLGMNPNMMQLNGIEPKITNQKNMNQNEIIINIIYKHNDEIDDDKIDYNSIDKDLLNKIIFIKIMVMKIWILIILNKLREL